MQKHTSAINLKDELLRLFREQLELRGFAIERKQAIAIAVLVVVAICGSVALHKISQPKPTVVAEAGGNQDLDRRAQAPKSPAKPAIADQKMVFVHVAGGVMRPGVYQLKEGSRVINAIEAAGGATPAADQNALNLAEKVCDGLKIFVPKKGETPPAVNAMAQSGVSQGGYYAAYQSSGGAVTMAMGTNPGNEVKLNLNTATAEQLDTLPGVGQVTAGKIIEYRNKCGSFKRVDELKEIDGIGNKKFEQLKDKLCVQ